MSINKRNVNMKFKLPAEVKAHFAKADPKILGVLETMDLSDLLEENPNSDHFYNLTRNIIYQQLAGKAASTIFSRFEKQLNGKIDPVKITQADPQSIRDCGLSWAKVKYVKDLAEKVITKEVIIDNLDTLDDESVINELVKVKGIGRWTAEMFLIFTLKRPNIFSFGDLGLANGFAKLYDMPNASIKDIESKVKLWHPYKSYGSLALWHHLDNR